MKNPLAMSRVFVALGANLGDKTAQLSRARRAICAMPGIAKFRASSLYLSAAVGSSEPQPDYLNAVVQFESVQEPLSMWRALTLIEQQLGRVRTSERNAARKIDIDLLLVGDCVIDSAELTLPHPRMQERAFVLAPLTELDPYVEIPGRGVASVLLANLVNQRCERIAESGVWS